MMLILAQVCFSQPLAAISMALAINGRVRVPTTLNVGASSVVRAANSNVLQMGAITHNAGKVIALAAGTEMAGLGAITLASYRGVSGLGVDITIGLLACLTATLLIAPAIGQLIDSARKP